MKKVELVPASEVVAGCIEIYDNVIENSEKLIEVADSLDKWQDAGIFTGPDSSGSEVNKNIRSNLTLGIDQFSYNVEPEFYEMCKTVWHYCDQYANKYDVSFYATEPAQILKYSPGEYYDPHCDAGPNVPRVVSALLYLNEVEEGGETEFVNFDIKVKPKPGRLVIFPSNYAYRHAARLPKKGTKYVAVFWMRG
jgi:hypothetical protein